MTLLGTRVGLLSFSLPGFAVAFDGTGIFLRNPGWTSKKGHNAAL